MRTLGLPTLCLIPAVVTCLIQVGAQLFAVVVLVGTMTEAPPRSLAILAGEYGYDSSPFWEVMPMVTALFLLIALGTNWKTARRPLLISSVVTFVIAGLFAAFLMGPIQAEVISSGYSNTVDEALRSRAALWHTLDWISWALVLVAGLLLAFALAVPVSATKNSPRVGVAA